MSTLPGQRHGNPLTQGGGSNGQRRGEEQDSRDGAPGLITPLSVGKLGYQTRALSRNTYAVQEYIVVSTAAKYVFMSFKESTPGLGHLARAFLEDK